MITYLKHILNWHFRPYIFGANGVAPLKNNLGLLFNLINAQCGRGGGGDFSHFFFFAHLASISTTLFHSRVILFLAKDKLFWKFVFKL